ncbi:hypothetical protein ACIQOF_18645 [Streptomyces sp. NPDC091265]|uniref:hypothetical protein n=1 Tax=unclassified Streptomyces TaxID=2593676 RepID=UPI00344F617A
MAITRRPLLTATAAGTLLCALWFVPSAHATGDTGTGPGRTSATGGTGADGTTLAETGTGIDTTPYLIGGTAFLGIGAAFVTHSGRRGGRHPAQ